MEVMDVMAIPQINTKKTAKRVRDFFKKEYPGICRRAGSSTVGIKAIVIDDMPKSPSYGNKVEENITDHIQRKVDYEKVVNAIKALDMVSQDIIIYDLILKNGVTRTSMRLHMMPSRYHDYKRYALNAFADSYEYQTFGEVDLHRYENEM